MMTYLVRIFLIVQGTGNEEYPTSSLAITHLFTSIDSDHFSSYPVFIFISISPIEVRVAKASTRLDLFSGNIAI
eukprot:747285-Hanusia_phi.AAC.4